jgi:hypothetical protein
MLRLREWLRANKRFANASSLVPKDVATAGEVSGLYVFYSELSADAAHPSITSLARYAAEDTAGQFAGIVLEPIVKEKEIEQTLELLCVAVLCVCIAVDQIIGRTHSTALRGLQDELIALSNKSASKAPADRSLLSYPTLHIRAGTSQRCEVVPVV